MDIPQSVVREAFRSYQGPRARLDPGRILLLMTSSTWWEVQPVPLRWLRPAIPSRLPEAHWMIHSSHFRKLSVASGYIWLRRTNWEVSQRWRVGHQEICMLCISSQYNHNINIGYMEEWRPTSIWWRIEGVDFVFSQKTWNRPLVLATIKPYLIGTMDLSWHCPCYKDSCRWIVASAVCKRYISAIIWKTTRDIHLQTLPPLPLL